MWSPAEPAVDVRLVPAAVTAWAVSAAAITWPVGPALTAAAAVAGLSWLVAWRVLGGRCRVLRAAGPAVLSVALVGAGFAVAATLRGDAVRHHPIVPHFGHTVAVTVTAADSPRPVGGGRVFFQAHLTAVGEQPMSGRVVVFAPAAGFAGLAAGRPARFTARIARPLRADLTVAALNARGRPALGEASAVNRAAASVRDGFAAAARQALPADQAAILPGLVLGDTAAVSPATTEAFRIAGLTHLTAVSGANVTIVCAAVLLVAGLLGPRVAAGLAAVALAAFVVVVQPSPSVLRAAMMGAVALLAVFTARRRQAVPALAATVLVLVLWSPHLAVDVGFALSVSATAALVLLAPRWAARLTSRGWPAPLAGAVAVAIAAHVVTAPLIAAISGRLSLVSVAANLLVAVTIPPITVLGTAAAALCPVWPGAAELIIRFTGPELWWLLTVAHRAAALPGAAVAVPAGWAGAATVGGVALGGSLLWRRRWFRWSAAAAVLCAVAWSVSGLVGGP